MKQNSVNLHRIIKTAPEKLFRAFTNKHAMASWMPPYGFIGKIDEFEPTPGGKYKMSFINFSTGSSHSFGGEFLEVILNKYIKYSNRFDDPKLPVEMITAVEFEKASCGTEIKITQQGIPEAIPIENCYLGWQESLEKLIKMVEPNIPDA